VVGDRHVAHHVELDQGCDGFIMAVHLDDAGQTLALVGEPVDRMAVAGKTYVDVASVVAGPPFRRVRGVTGIVQSCRPDLVSKGVGKPFVVREKHLFAIGRDCDAAEILVWPSQQFCGNLVPPGSGIDPIAAGSGPALFPLLHGAVG